ncbi:MAG: hypothetical protein QM765_09445 [Myxococcales bacterium]
MIQRPAPSLVVSPAGLLSPGIVTATRTPEWSVPPSPSWTVPLSPPVCQSIFTVGSTEVCPAPTATDTDCVLKPVSVKVTL